jgi:hypothetical protein
MEVGGHLIASAALLPGKELLVPHGCEAVWAPEAVVVPVFENRKLLICTIRLSSKYFTENCLIDEDL